VAEVDAIDGVGDALGGADEDVVDVVVVGVGSGLGEVEYGCGGGCGGGAGLGGRYW